MTDTAELVIRPLTRGDKEQWRELWAGYLAFYSTALSAEVYDSTFERLIGDDARDFHGVVAEIEGELVGLVHFLFHRHCWKIEDVIYLQDLFTLKHYRGQGIGRALIEAVYAYGDQAGAPTVYWLTQDYNTQARELYDQVADVTPFIKYQRSV
jgi:GNAT superfamily N-acetyltransferase